MISRFLRYGCFFLIFFAHAIKTEEILIVEEKIISTAEWKEIGTSHVINEERIKNELLFALSQELQSELESEIFPERLDILFETTASQGLF